MKRKLTFLALALLCVGAISHQAYAADEKDYGVSLEVGADLVSGYLWRGYNLGGLSLQPSVTLDWRGLYLCGWANIGADNWKFQAFNPELDITIGYDNFGFKLDFTHLYYFDGSTYFRGLGDANNKLGTTTAELHAGVDFGEWFEKVPLTFDWYTNILGYDPILDEEGQALLTPSGNAKRAYSTYIQLGYDIYLPLDIVLGLKLGFTPWRGMYSDYEEVWTSGRTVGINNIQLRAEREFELDNLYINVWGEAMFNCYGVTPNNVIMHIGEGANQKLNACIGVGIYFGEEW